MRKRSRMGIVGGNRSMFKVFMDMLAGVGGSFTAYVPEPRKEPKPEREWAKTSPIRISGLNVLADGKHTRDQRGVVTRNTPKRDKSISARQWKKQVKAARMAARSKSRVEEVAA